MQALTRAGVSSAGIPLVEFPAPEGERFHYRNRIQLRGEGTKLGFLARGSKSLVPVETCAIARGELNSKFPALREQGARTPGPYKVEIEVAEDGAVHAHWNQKHAQGGFRQVHDAQNARLRQWVEARVPDDQRVLDLFGGSGNLSLSLAYRSREVHCVDLGKNALAKAVPASFRLVRGDVARWLDGFRPTTAAPTLAILDPPREGLGADFARIAEGLARVKAHTILAIGCDADSFARDVSRFSRRGWALTELGALDFFPQTPHVEALAVLRVNAELASG